MKIKYSDSFVATVKELKEMDYIDEELVFHNTIHCGLCFATSDKDDEKWFVFTGAGSGSMDDFLCEDCIKEIKKCMELLK